MATAANITVTFTASFTSMFLTFLNFNSQLKYGTQQDRNDIAPSLVRTTGNVSPLSISFPLLLWKFCFLLWYFRPINPFNSVAVVINKNGCYKMKFSVCSQLYCIVSYWSPLKCLRVRCQPALSFPELLFFPYPAPPCSALFCLFLSSTSCSTLPCSSLLVITMPFLTLLWSTESSIDPLPLPSPHLPSFHAVELLVRCSYTTYQNKLHLRM